MKSERGSDTALAKRDAPQQRSCRKIYFHIMLVDIVSGMLIPDYLSVQFRILGKLSRAASVSACDWGMAVWFDDDSLYDSGGVYKGTVSGSLLCAGCLFLLCVLITMFAAVADYSPFVFCHSTSLILPMASRCRNF